MNLREHLQVVGRGSVTSLGKRLGVPASLISDWASGNRPIPASRCAAIEAATAGAVTRRDLRPDDWHLIWPELATEPATAREGANV